MVSKRLVSEKWREWSGAILGTSDLRRTCQMRSCLRSCGGYGCRILQRVLQRPTVATGLTRCRPRALMLHTSKLSSTPLTCYNDPMQTFSCRLSQTSSYHSCVHPRRNHFFHARNEPFASTPASAWSASRVVNHFLTLITPFYCLLGPGAGLERDAVTWRAAAARLRTAARQPAPVKRIPRTPTPLP